MPITIDITDAATPMLSRVQRALTSGAVENVMGRAASNLVKNHLFGLEDTRPNQLGGRRTHFWASAAKSTHYQSQAGSVLISVSKQGALQRLLGGVIRPVNKQYLTIPAAPEAHGKRAGEFSNLRFGFAVNKYGNLQPALVEASASTVAFGRKRKDGSRAVQRTGSVGGAVMYFLVKQVYQKPDPTVMPENDDIASAALQAAGSYINRLARGGARA